MAISKERLEAQFSEVFKNLNPEQQIAVNTLEGPVMVIAGPGTGKTQILAARIGKILLETDALPENVLCLTYTDAGVVAMRKRLQQFIGADAYKVNLYTFHAFCNDVIQDNLSLFEKTSLDPVSDLEQVEYFKQLIDGFSKEHPLKRYRGDVYYEAGPLSQLFSTMKREGWSPAYLHERIDDYAKLLADDESFIYKTNRAGKWKKGDRKPAYDEELRRLEKLRAAVDEFENYQDIMRRNKRYDFDDMINWVIAAFEENPNLLSDYQERFQYILVDEFQDTSGTQNKIVQLLISYWEQPNIFVVGDDDQSIYRFQGANIQNMLDFANQYVKDLRTIVLTSNYRSVQPILDVSKTLINRNEERLVKQIPGLSKELVAANLAISHLQHQPTITEYNSVAEEMAGLVFEIEDLVTAGVAPGNIAVIYKENKYGETLAGYLRQKNIPFYSKRNVNLLHAPFIKKIIKILYYLEAEQDTPYRGDELLFEILHFDFYNNPPIEIAKLNVEANQRRFKNDPTSLRELLYEKANRPPRDLFDEGLNQSLKNCSHLLEQLIGDVNNVTIQQLIDHIIQTAGVLTYIMNNDQKIELMQSLTAFYDFIKEENRRNPSLDLTALVQLFGLMEKEDIPLPLMRTTGNDKGVNLLTAHGSKGLEFEHVFFAGANASFWEKKRKRSMGYKLPSTIFSSQSKTSDEEELRRVFYVALTRAEQFLHISYAKLNAEGKELEPSMFIAEIQEQHQFEVQKKQLDPEKMFAFQHLMFSGYQPVIRNLEDDFIEGLLSKFVMNVTALNSYLSCPLKFYYQNLLRIPSGKNEATEFGSAIHFALERLFRKLKDNEQFAPVETMLDDFSWYMMRHRQSFTKEAFERRMEQGSIIIPAYYKKYVDSWNKVVAVETNIKAVIVNDIPLKGKLDKLEFSGKEVNVVDYKTGNVDRALSKLRAPYDKAPDGGDYWRQAVFYKILLDNYELKDWKVVSTEFDFIEPDGNNNFQKIKVVITPEDVSFVREQIKTVWDKIQAKDFYKGCGREDCHWCNFVKDNYLYSQLEAPEEEEELF
ncbi:ATP-dependent helicase [Niabella insulamsoli]|uniref:ATP-dependent helicase n=1 Tax=Niabella insulamsoli TaxID=3144874 RepID=UPI0031FE2FC0